MFRALDPARRGGALGTRVRAMHRAIWPFLLATAFAACGAPNDGVPSVTPYTSFPVGGDGAGLTKLPPAQDDGRLPPPATPLRYSRSLKVDAALRRFSGG